MPCHGGGRCANGGGIRPARDEEGANRWTAHAGRRVCFSLLRRRGFFLMSPGTPGYQRARGPTTMSDLYESLLVGETAVGTLQRQHTMCPIEALDPLCQDFRRVCLSCSTSHPQHCPWGCSAPCPTRAAGLKPQLPSRDLRTGSSLCVQRSPSTGSTGRAAAVTPPRDACRPMKGWREGNDGNNAVAHWKFTRTSHAS